MTGLLTPKFDMAFFFFFFYKLWDVNMNATLMININAILTCDIKPSNMRKRIDKSDKRVS